jgi:hypothetical protein
MNESGNNYTTIVRYANRRSGFASPEANVTAADDDDNNLNNFFRSEVQFVFAYEHIPDEGEDDDDDNTDDDDSRSDGEDDEHQEEDEEEDYN